MSLLWADLTMTIRLSNLIYVIPSFGYNRFPNSPVITFVNTIWYANEKEKLGEAFHISSEIIELKYY